MSPQDFQQNPLAGLPDELLLEIAGLCSRRDLLSLCLTNKRIKKIASDSLYEYLTYLTVKPQPTLINRLKKVAGTWDLSSRVRYLRLCYFEPDAEVSERFWTLLKERMDDFDSDDPDEDAQLDYFSEWLDDEVAPNLKHLSEVEYIRFEGRSPSSIYHCNSSWPRIDVLDYLIEPGIWPKRVVMDRGGSEVGEQELEGSGDHLKLTYSDGCRSNSRALWGLSNWPGRSTKLAPRSVTIHRSSINYRDVMAMLDDNKNLTELSLDECEISEIPDILIKVKGVILKGRSDLKFSMTNIFKIGHRINGVFSISTARFNHFVLDRYPDLLGTLELTFGDKIPFDDRKAWFKSFHQIPNKPKVIDFPEDTDGKFRPL